MGNQLPSYCLRCFRDSPSSPELSQTDIIAYLPPSESPSASARSPQKGEIEAVKPVAFNDVEEEIELEECVLGFRTAEISNLLEEAWTGLLDLTKTDVLPSLHSKDEVSVYGRETPRGFCLKTVWTVPQSSQEFLRFIRKFHLRPLWDPNVEVGEQVTELRSGVVINYQKFRKVMTVSSRELLVACKTMQTSNPTVEVSVSVDSPQFPERVDAVRIKMFIGGYFLERLESGTRVTAVSEMDFGGAIPRGFVMKMSAMAMPKFVKGLNTALREDAKSDLLSLTSH